jgi:hypothetical protein
VVDVAQGSIGSVVHGSTVKDSGWENALRPDERLPNLCSGENRSFAGAILHQNSGFQQNMSLVLDFDLKASCPVCQRDDGLLQIGDTMFCASCGYASEGAVGCT